MCLDCGCNQPDDRHGDDRHLIMQDIVDAAKASQKPVDKAMQNIDQAVRQVMEGKIQSKAYQPG